MTEQTYPWGTLFIGLLGLLMLLVTSDPVSAKVVKSQSIDQFLVVDCLLPSQVRRLGTLTYAAARKAIKTSTRDCEKRGGEYVAYDRASYATTLKVWLPLAEEGDAKAQTYVGEAYEKGHGLRPDYGAAAFWYMKAAEQGYSRAAINLGNLFEQGLGLEKDTGMASFWYRQASDIEGIQSVLAPKVKPVSATKILIIEPELDQRGLKIAYLQSDDTNNGILIIGQIQSQVPILKVSINNVPAKMVGDTIFRGKVSRLSKKVEIVATDNRQQKTRLVFPLYREGSEKDAIDNPNKYRELGIAIDKIKDPIGHYHALIIGNNRYDSLPLLDTAVNDARELDTILKNAYGFSTDLLIDADRYQILSALNQLRHKFDENTHLLIYYAGHGELDRVNSRGHWLPVNAEADSHANWISNVSITDMLNIIPARQILVIADSCYSGMMSRSVLGAIDASITLSQKQQLLQTLSGERTRVAFTAGGVGPVLDSLNGVNSVFANELIQALKQNNGAMTGFELFQAVSPQVVQKVEKVGFEQVPEYAPLKFAGHESGDFVFYKIH